MTDEPKQRPVTYDGVGVKVDPVLSRFERLAEIGAGLGVPVPVGPVEVPQPSLVSMALLECLDSPFVCPAAEGEPPREVTRKHVIEALYVLSCPERALAPVDAAMRARAAVQAAEKRAAASPELWEVYLDALATTARAAYAAFDGAMWAWAAELPPVDTEALADALDSMIAMASRGYALVPPGKDDDGSKKKSTSESTASSGWRSMLSRCIGRLAARFARRFTKHP